MNEINYHLTHAISGCQFINLHFLNFINFFLFFFLFSRKYERTKQMASELKDREAVLIAEKRALEESLKLQEQRYEKMKHHAVLQLDE